MGLAEKIEWGMASQCTIQETVQEDGPASALMKYDQLMDVLSEDHQLVLGVLQSNTTPSYRANTPLTQETIDVIFMRGPSLLRMVDQDMKKIVEIKGCKANHNIFSSLYKLRKSFDETIRNYSRLVGSVDC